MIRLEHAKGDRGDEKEDRGDEKEDRGDEKEDRGDETDRDLRDGVAKFCKENNRNGPLPVRINYLTHFLIKIRVRKENILRKVMILSHQKRQERTIESLPERKINGRFAMVLN